MIDQVHSEADWLHLRNQQLEHELTLWRKAFLKYAQHTPGCQAAYSFVTNSKCTCGYFTVLTAARNGLGLLATA